MEDPTRAVAPNFEDMTSLVEQWARACIAEDWDNPLPGWYRDMDIDSFACLAFEAGRAKGLEEAAKVCERKVDSALGIVLGPDCAAAIRSLAPAVPT